MINLHSSFTKRMIDEVCLGTRLEPIRECILDVLDLAIKLEDARRAEANRETEATQELSRLSVYASSPAKPRQRYMQPSEEEDETFLEEQDRSMFHGQDDSDKDDDDADHETRARSYSRVLRDMADELDRHLKFLCSGLRAVARASTNTAAAKWDTLAEMLELGVLESRPFAT